MCVLDHRFSNGGLVLWQVNVDSFFVMFVNVFISLHFSRAYLLCPQPGLLDKQACPEGSTFPSVEQEDPLGDVFAAQLLPYVFLPEIPLGESNSVQKKSKPTKCVYTCLSGWRSMWKGVGERWT